MGSCLQNNEIKGICGFLCLAELPSCFKKKKKAWKVKLKVQKSDYNKDNESSLESQVLVTFEEQKGDQSQEKRKKCSLTSTCWKVVVAFLFWKYAFLYDNQSMFLFFLLFPFKFFLIFFFLFISTGSSSDISPGLSLFYYLGQCAEALNRSQQGQENACMLRSPGCFCSRAAEDGASCSPMANLALP